MVQWFADYGYSGNGAVVCGYSGNGVYNSILLDTCCFTAG